MKRTPLKAASDSRRRENTAYSKERKWFLAKAENSFCGACLARSTGERWENAKARLIERGRAGFSAEAIFTAASEIHHSRGRIGRLLCDTRFFIGVCSPCHDWLHGHTREARALGLLATATEWATFPGPEVRGFPAA